MKQYLRMAIQNISHRKVRSWLTMIGIFIGITALIAIVSLGQGLERAITDEFNSLGNDKLFIQPGTSAFGGSSSAANLTDRDLRVIERVPGVYQVVGMSYRSARVEHKEEEVFALVMGYTARNNEELWYEVYEQNVLMGRWHDTGDTFKAVVGWDYTQDDRAFPRKLELFDTITINGFDFKIIGFQERIGNSADDQTVFITDDAYEDVFGQPMEDDFKFMMVKVSSGEDPLAVAERIERDLRIDRDLDIGEEDFQIQTTEELLDTFNSILQIVQVVIAGIAAISLLVGGIGIMNTMYTAVLERTKEIGIMKAVGARNRDILSIFLIESAVLGFIGGTIGVLLGIGIAKATEYFGKNVLGIDLLQAWFSWELIVATILFAMVIGTVSGLLPARQASRQQAVISLRYE